LADQRPILTDDSIDEMHRPTKLGESEARYGIGWATGPGENGLRILSHGGGMGGVATALRLLPEKNAAIVVLCNSSSGGATQRIAQKIQRILVSEATKAKAPRQTEAEGSDKGGSGSRKPAGPQFRPMPDLKGVWNGEVSTYEGSLPVTFAIRASGEVYVRLGVRPWTVLDQAKFSDGVLKGIFVGDVGTVDANRRPYNLRLEVKKRDEVLNGSLIALSLPGNRAGNALTHWIEVRRDERAVSRDLVPARVWSAVSWVKRFIARTLGEDSAE
jgi:hypothetical protein